MLKLARAAEDALTGILWRDDAQICDEVIRKRYGEPARVEIEVRTLGESAPLTPITADNYGELFK